MGDEDRGDSDLTEAQWDEVETIEAKLDAIDHAHTDFKDEDKARGGAVVHLKRNGEPEIVRGLMRQENQPAEKDVEAKVPTVPHAAHRRCTEIATQALARELAKNPAEADIILTAALAQSLFQMSCAAGIKLSLSGLTPSEKAELPVNHALAERMERYAEEASYDFAETLAMVAKLSDAERQGLRAFALAESLDFTELRTDNPDHSARKTATLVAERIGADVRRHWTPDEAYFTELPKSLLVEALHAMGSRETGLESCKKGDLVPMAVRRAKASGWLPESVRFAQAPEEAPAAEESDEPDVDATVPMAA